MSMRSSNRLRCASEKRSIGLLCTHLHTYMSIIDLQLFCIVLPSLAATGTSSVSKENLARNCNTKCGLSALSTNICSWCYYVICTNSSSQRQWFSALGQQKQKSAPRSFYFFSAGGTGPESKRYSMNFGNWCLNKLATKMPRVYCDGLLSARSANLVVRDSRLYSLVEKNHFGEAVMCRLACCAGSGGRGEGQLPQFHHCQQRASSIPHATVQDSVRCGGRTLAPGVITSRRRHRHAASCAAAAAAAVFMLSR